MKILYLVWRGKSLNPHQGSTFRHTPYITVGNTYQKLQYFAVDCLDSCKMPGILVWVLEKKYIPAQPKIAIVIQKLRTFVDRPGKIESFKESKDLLKIKHHFEIILK